MDAVLTQHAFLGVNEVTGANETLIIEDFGVTDGTKETYDDDRVERCSDADGDGANDVGSGVNWTDEHISLAADRGRVETASATASGVDDWVQAVEGSRAVILFFHESVGATQFAAPADIIVVTADFNGGGMKPAAGSRTGRCKTASRATKASRAAPGSTGTSSASASQAAHAAS